MGTLIEYENSKDFTDKSILDIQDAKKEMLKDIKECKLCITDEYDVKKAFELIERKYKL